jgi:hypothetical protein
MARINRDTLKAAICDHVETLCRHYYPNGKRIGNQWVVGNVNGDAGQSLKIELEGEKAGLTYDFATSEGCDFLDLVKKKTGLRFLEAARDIGSVIGINVEESGTSRASGAGGRYRTSSSTKPCDWDRDYKMPASGIDDLITERGYSREFCEWLVTKRLIGQTKKGNWAFPVYDNGVIVAAHVRITKNNWRYEPKLKDLGVNLGPFVVGDTSTADKVFVDESQWDIFSTLDRLGAHRGEHIAGISTRGSSNAALVATIQVKADLYAIPQNDEAGKKWTESLGTALSKEFKVIVVPSDFHDADDWLRALSDIGEFIEAIRNAKSHRPAKDKIFIEFFRPSYFINYQIPQDLVLIGDNHIVRNTVTVLGGPPGVGKSRAIIASAIAGARRVPWFGMEVHSEFRTLIIQSENGMLRLKDELSAIAQTGLEDHLMICPPPPYGLCFAKDLFRDQLKRFRDEFGPQMVWVDPWNAVALSDQIRDYRETFDIVCETLNLNSLDGPSIGVAAHTRKPMMGERVSGRALLNLLSGSYILGSVPRSVFIMQSASDRVDETRIVWTCTKNNNGPLGNRSAWERRNGLFVPADAFDWKEFAGRTTDGGKEDGRSKRKIESTVDDTLALIPENGAILKIDLQKAAEGKVARDDLRDFIAQLLREQRLYIHKIPVPGRQRGLPAYSRFPPANQNDDTDDTDIDIEDDLEDDPR